MRVLVGLVAIFLAQLPASAAVEAEASDAARGHSFTLLVYNVHGLFPLAAKDDPRNRMPTIGWLANRYPVVLFQEDFEYHHILGAQLEQSVGYRGNGMGWDPRRVLLKLLISPVAIFLPHFSPPYGAGVSTFAQRPIEIGEVERVPYSRCNGWFGQNGDCWSRKGFLMTRLRLPGGAEVDVYNTHLEAGPTPRSVSVRSHQFSEIAEGIERLSPGRAVIAAGDFNVAFIRPGDRDMMMGFRERVRLDDTGAAPELPVWRERGFVLYRSGDATRLSVEASGEAQEFVNGSRALSDHAALWVRVRAEAVAP
jgi:hypothetical protein